MSSRQQPDGTEPGTGTLLPATISGTGNRLTVVLDLAAVLGSRFTVLSMSADPDGTVTLELHDPGDVPPCIW